MEGVENLGPRVIIWFDEGPLAGLRITETAIWAVIVSILLVIFALVSTRKLKKYPKGVQAYVEFIVELVYKYVKDVMGKQNLAFAPFIGTLFLFLLVSNAMGLFGIRPVTADLNTTFALALLVFFLIHYNAIRSGGIKHYLKEYTKPFAVFAPVNILGEFSFPISLAFRLFGNILAGVLVMTLVLIALEKLSIGVLHLPIPFLQIGIPIPLNLFFDMFEAVLQAFVFSMLTMAFISKAIVVRNPEEK